jgi:hypothetical protein
MARAVTDTPATPQTPEQVAHDFLDEWFGAQEYLNGPAAAHRCQAVGELADAIRRAVAAAEQRVREECARMLDVRAEEYESGDLFANTGKYRAYALRDAAAVIRAVGRINYTPTVGDARAAAEVAGKETT